MEASIQALNFCLLFDLLAFSFVVCGCFCIVYDANDAILLLCVFDKYLSVSIVAVSILSCEKIYSDFFYSSFAVSLSLTNKNKV